MLLIKTPPTPLTTAETYGATTDATQDSGERELIISMFRPKIV